MDIEEDGKDRALAAGWLRIMLSIEDEILVESLTALIKARRMQALTGSDCEQGQEGQEANENERA